MNSNDVWIAAYLITLWKTNNTELARQNADTALVDYKKAFNGE